MYPTKQTPAQPSCSTGEGRTHVAPQVVMIHAKDIMTTDVVSVNPRKSVQDIAALMTEKKISAVLVIDHMEIVGIVSEGDLIQREELGTATTLSGNRIRGGNADYAKSHGRYAADVMTRHVITVSEDTSIANIAESMQTNHIHRVPVMQNGRVVGIVSRSDIVRTLAKRPPGAGEPTDSDDDMIRFKVIETLLNIRGASPWLTRVDVVNGVVELTGTAEDENALDPSRDAIERLAHVVGVKDHRSVVQAYGRG